MSLRFVARERSEFSAVLRARVKAYFTDNQLSQKDDGSVAVKAVVVLAMFLLPFMALLIWQPPVWGWVAMAVIQGAGMAGMGMCIMHDSIHGAFSKSQRVNEAWGKTMYLMGGSVFDWKLQHNKAHHTYTNIFGHDEDIRDRGFLRFSPMAKWHPWQRYQHIYALALYPLLSLSMLVGDFASLGAYEQAGWLKEAKTTYKAQLWQLIWTKSLWLAALIGLPVALGALSIWASLGYFLLFTGVAGFIFSVVFQLAHIVEEATHPEPVSGSTVENEWMIHQLETTVNFCPESPVLNWYTGGLNYQVEHHLFPNICHAHYPALSRIVKETAGEFGVAYHSIYRFRDSMASHLRMLKRLGAGPDVDMPKPIVPYKAPKAVGVLEMV